MLGGQSIETCILERPFFMEFGDPLNNTVVNDLSTIHKGMHSTYQNQDCIIPTKSKAEPN